MENNCNIKKQKIESQVEALLQIKMQNENIENKIPLEFIKREEKRIERLKKNFEKTCGNI